jgi:hypothetical protein
MKFRSIFSAGWPSRSYIAKKKNGSINPIISIAAPSFPMVPRLNKYVGTPTAAADEKHMSWRFVKFKAIFVLTDDKSL